MACSKNITVSKDSFMSKLYLHIGAHKTGTTSLQYVLDNNKDTIFKEDNVFYPESCRFHYAHHRLAFAMKGMKDPGQGDVPNLDLEIEELLNEVKGVKQDNRESMRVVISSEEFFTASESSIKSILREVRDVFSEIEVCAVVRRYDNQFISIYNQKVKSPYNGFFRPVSFYLKDPGLLDDELYYGKHLRKWKDCLVGNESLRIFFYEDYSDMAKGLLGHMLGRDVGDISSAHINKSVPVKYLEFLRHLKSQVKDLEALEKISRRAYLYFKPQEFESILSYEERLEVLKKFEADNLVLGALSNKIPPYEKQSLIDEDTEFLKVRLTVNDVISFFVSSPCE